MQRKQHKKAGKISSKDWSKTSVGIVVSDFNGDITGKLLDGALGFLLEQGFKKEHIAVVHVPGSFEIPLACQRLARTNLPSRKASARQRKYKGIIAIGAVIKGDTDHYYYISNEASRGIMQVMLEESLPIAFGVITTSNLKQARDRSGTKNNKGMEAAEALLNMLI